MGHRDARQTWLQWLGVAMVAIAGAAIGPAIDTADAADCEPRTAAESAKANARATDSALAYLRNVMDQYHGTVDVYTDADAAGNHFHYRGRISSLADSDSVAVMDERCRITPYGTTCIRCVFNSGATNWGGWYFMNGVLTDSARAPRENWGKEPNAGINLKGVRRLRFRTRGKRGGERIEFFTLGVGRDPDRGTRIDSLPYPDSSPKVSTGVLSLQSTWRQDSIDLKGHHLEYVLGGFGWSASGEQNRGRRVEFYIDDIRFEYEDQADSVRLSAPRLLRSFETIADGGDFDRVMQNVAYVYDNAVVLIAFLAVRDTARARIIANALLHAQNKDRHFKDDRLRNAYQAGDIMLGPGWRPNKIDDVARLPGWYDPYEKQWFEDGSAAGTSTGNVAWAMLAMLAAHEELGDRRYLESAEKMGKWVVDSCRARVSPLGGFFGGFEGNDHEQVKQTYRATEHNIDLMAAFARLAILDSARREYWEDQSDHARRFVHAMWDSIAGKFWTGTQPGSDSINRETIPLDVQAWFFQASGELGDKLRAITFAERNQRVEGGFDFNDDKDGAWFEGTAQMAVTYDVLHRQSERDTVLCWLREAQLPSGALPTTNRSVLTTGLHLANGCPWLYYRRAHLAPTAWFVLAVRGVNPFTYRKVPPRD
jgi:hypothetical protein